MADLKYISLYGTCKHLEDLEPIECYLDEVPLADCWQCQKSWKFIAGKWWLITRISAHD